MRKSEPGVVRLDITSSVNPDVVWDLNQFPYPFEDSSFAEIECFAVIEHVDSIIKTLEEFHRILLADGTLKITTPHFSSANSFVDPTHKWHLSYFSFDYFCENSNLSYYSKVRFRIKNRYIDFKGSKLSQAILRRLANRFPRNYEQRWAWIFPAFSLYFELQPIHL